MSVVVNIPIVKKLQLKNSLLAIVPDRSVRFDILYLSVYKWDNVIVITAMSSHGSVIEAMACHCCNLG